MSASAAPVSTPRSDTEADFHFVTEEGLRALIDAHQLRLQTQDMRRRLEAAINRVREKLDLPRRDPR
jgi:hypothetical protein